MRDFTKVSSMVWQSSRFMSGSDEERLLYLYFLTCEHQNSAGAYRLPDGYACTDLKWPAEKYVRAREGLISADLIGFDEAECIMVVKRWFRHNPPMNDKHLKGILNVLRKLPPADIVLDAIKEAENAWDAAKSRGSRPQPAPATGKHHLLSTAYLNGGR